MLVADGFEKYKDSLIRSIAIFSGDEQAAQDAVQYAFLKAVMNRELLEQMPELAMKAWLSAAARNAVVDSKRKQSRLVYSLDETLLSENRRHAYKLSSASGIIQDFPPPKSDALWEFLHRLFVPCCGRR